MGKLNETKEDFVGRKFGRLTVIRWMPREGWECICSCGNITVKITSHLKSGTVLSCGCYKKETQVNNCESATREFTSYNAMLMRTNNGSIDAADNPKLKLYIDKGRRVCDRWLEPRGAGYANFKADMGPRPEGTTLERKNNALGYTPENCIWDTVGNQCYNRDKFSNNTSGKTGVYLRKESGKWRAKITVRGDTINLGDFFEFYDAVKAREEAELKYYGFIKE